MPVSSPKNSSNGVPWNGLEVGCRTVFSARIGTTVGLFVLRDMFAAYALGMWLLVPWFWSQADLAHVIYALVVNLLFLVATIPEMGEYFERRRNGDLQQIKSWGEFRRSHPAVRGKQSRGE